MAGNFTINVVVTGAGAGGQGSGGGTGRGRIDESAVAGFAAASQGNLGIVSKDDAIRKAFQTQNARNFNITNENRKFAGMAPYQLKYFDEKTGAFMGSAVYSDDYMVLRDEVRGSDIQKIRNRSFLFREAYSQRVTGTSIAIDAEPGSPTYGQTDSRETFDKTYIMKFGGSGLEDHLGKHRKRYGALLTATAVKATSEAIAFYQHTSGDSYANQQLSNAAKLAAYGSAIAFSGPLAGFIAAGIAITEVIGLIGDVAKYDFNRKIERNEITNNMIAAGNASYGRMRGVGV